MAAVSPTDRLIWSTICTIQATPKMKISLYSRVQTIKYMKYPVISYIKRYTSWHAWNFASSLPLTSPPGLTSWSDLPCNWPPRQPRRSSFVLQRVARQLLDLSEAEWYSKFSHHGKIILCLWAAFFQGAGSSRPGGGGMGYNL